MLFDVDAAAASWKALQSGLPDEFGERTSTWRRLISHLRRHGFPQLDGGLIRVIALFGENIITACTENQLCFDAEFRHYEISADPTHADPRERYLLSKAGRFLWDDPILHHSRKRYVNICHARPMEARNNPGFSLLHDALSTEITQAQSRQDTEELARLNQILHILRYIGTMKAEEPSSYPESSPTTDFSDRIFAIDDDNIDQLRLEHPEGLHFAVGDLHCEVETLKALMQKLRFDPAKDHVYFVGDYNAGRYTPRLLLTYMANYFQADHTLPGFHMIRGNHERELCPMYDLENLPDILVYQSPHMKYFIAHAGMVSDAFTLICQDIQQSPGKQVYAYKLHQSCLQKNNPLYQITWSRNGLYSQKSKNHVWPSEDMLREHNACIIHGHTPYVFLMKGNYFSYGDRNLFWENQHIWFSEDLQSFNIDANIKGRHAGSDTYRGLSCICLEVLDEIAAQNHGSLSIPAIRAAKNLAFAVPLCLDYPETPDGDINLLLSAAPEMKTIRYREDGTLVIE